MFERVALMASRCGDAYATSMAVEGSARTTVVPELGIFSTWTEAERIARGLNTDLGLSSIGVQTDRCGRAPRSGFSYLP